MATKVELAARLKELTGDEVNPDDTTHDALTQRVNAAEAAQSSGGSGGDTPDASNDIPTGAAHPVIGSGDSDPNSAQLGREIKPDANPYGGGVLNPDAPRANVQTDIREAVVGVEKPAPDTIAQVEEVRPLEGGNADDD